MEVYGEKPKAFTKKWWENYFYYYKVHTIVAVAVFFVLGYLIYSDATATKYDLKIDYISENGISEEAAGGIAEIAEKNILDATGNGEIDVFVLTLNMQETTDIQYAQAMQVKFMTEQAYSESFAFIMSKQYADMMCGNGVFEPISVWSGQDSSEECMSISGCSALSDIGLPTEDLYIAVRKLRDEELKDERKLAEYQNGVLFAKFLIDER